MDYALLWLFISDWSDLLAVIPNSLVLTRQELLQRIWLEPIYKVVEKYLLQGGHTGG
jgi:hypothetical protein